MAIPPRNSSRRVTTMHGSPGLRNRQERYEAALRELPRPGKGDGFHTGMLGVANYGHAAGIPRETVEADLIAIAQTGSRKVPPREIRSAIDHAWGTSTLSTSTRPMSRRARARAARRAAIERDRREAEQLAAARRALAAAGSRRAVAAETLRDLGVLRSAEAEQIEALRCELWHRSPVLIGGDPDWRLCLESLYSPGEWIWIGGSMEPGIPAENLRTVEDWLRIEQPRGNFWIPNPLSGSCGLSQDGKPSYRCDAVVADRRFILVEMDSIGRVEQLAWWLGQTIVAVAAIVDSGNKSIHALLPTWQFGAQIEHAFTELVLIGADPTGRTRSRLSRLPGARRGSRRQELYYLNPGALAEPSAPSTVTTYGDES